MLHIVCSKFIFTGIKAFFSPGRKFIFKLFEVKCDYDKFAASNIWGGNIYSLEIWGAEENGLIRACAD